MVKQIKCIDTSECLGHLTEGAIYKVIIEDRYFYTIIDDVNKEYGYFKNRFEIFENKTYELWTQKERLKIAKELYPIGTKFYPVHENGIVSTCEYEQKEECFIYNDSWIIGSANICNPSGQWAKKLNKTIHEVW